MKTLAPIWKFLTNIGGYRYKKQDVQYCYRYLYKTDYTTSVSTWLFSAGDLLSILLQAVVIYDSSVFAGKLIAE